MKMTQDADLEPRLKKLKAEQDRLFDLKTDLELKGQIFSAEELRGMRDAEIDFDTNAGTDLAAIEASPWKKLPKTPERVKMWRQLPDGRLVLEDVDRATEMRVKLSRLVAARAKTVLVWARNDRFEAASRLWPEIPPSVLEDVDLLNGEVELTQEKAVQMALRNRWDLMNARAQVVDAWRQIRVTANALLGVATVQYNLTSQTAPDGVRPLVFTSASTNQQLLLNFQLPLNRLAQRNAYRAAQIDYQVARRALMVEEDNIAVQVRFDVRQLQLFAANYRIQKKVMHSLYAQLENNLEIIESPTDPEALKGSSTTGQATAAALTNQYLGALSQLNGAQTKMYDIWLSIYATRMQLYLDLERLPMDERGVWIDDTLTPYDPAKAMVPPPPQALEAPGAGQRLLPLPVVQGVGLESSGGRPAFLAPPVVAGAGNE